MKIATIVGARPQFIKAAVVSRVISQINKRAKRKSSKITEMIIHTGQHFDRNMSDVFFEEMSIPRPDYFLDINGLSHGAMTGQMLEKIEGVLQKEKPDIVLVYGDTNTTLSGALAAVKLHIPVAHVEAGLRSFNRRMPEEVNRVLTDHVASFLFCPTDQAVKNLKIEGIGTGSASADRPVSPQTPNLTAQEPNNSKAHSIHERTPRVAMVGDVMQDAAMYYRQFARKPRFSLAEKFILATIHRAENTDDPSRLEAIFDGMNKISKELAIYLPLHPRTRKMLEALGLKTKRNAKIKTIEPVSYLEMIYMLEKCTLVMTDSGGLQKEAFFFKKPCITLRDETEWVELVNSGVNYLAGADAEKIFELCKYALNISSNFSLRHYGNGKSGNKIIDILSAY